MLWNLGIMAMAAEDGQASRTWRRSEQARRNGPEWLKSQISKRHPCNGAYGMVRAAGSDRPHPGGGSDILSERRM